MLPLCFCLLKWVDLACAGSIAIQEREAELNVLKGEIAALRKNTGEAKNEKNTWTTKYDALERNFKQVRRACLFLPVRLCSLTHGCSLGERNRNVSDR